LLIYRDKISNLYRGPSIDASYQVLVHLAKRFQRRTFLKIGEKHLKHFLGHLANVSFCHHLASVVHRPLTFHILIFSSETPQPNELKLNAYNHKHELPLAAMFVNGSGRNEQSL
jgi:hypothetical protein